MKMYFLKYITPARPQGSSPTWLGDKSPGRLKKRAHNIVGSERGDKTPIASIPRGNADSLNTLSLQSVIHFKLEINGQKPSQFTQSNG